MKRALLASVALAALAATATAQDPLTRALMNFDGAWRAAAIAAHSDSVTSGLRVAAFGTDTPSCQTPEDLLIAEAETVLRTSAGISVRPAPPLAGVEGLIRVVSLELEIGQQCISALHMQLVLRRMQGYGDDAYFGSVVVDEGLIVLRHPFSDHRRILRENVNEQFTVWANQLVRNRPGEP